MAKKLFVPERMTKSPEAPKSDIPPAINQAFQDDEADSKNNEDPSKMETSALERLPQPVGYRLLVIPYYMKAKTALEASSSPTRCESERVLQLLQLTS